MILLRHPRKMNRALTSLPCLGSINIRATIIMKLLVFILIFAIGLAIGGTIASHMFFGLLTLIGFIVLVESIPVLKWLIYRTSGLFDIIIFGVCIFATIRLGVTITAALTLAGIGFSLVYRPYIQTQMDNKKNSKNS